jgi:hypothetical protein
MDGGLRISAQPMRNRRWTMNPLLSRQSVTMKTAVHRFICYPFTPDDLSCLLWAAANHRPARDAIVQAENRATDDPGRRAWADAYIADCLANIRRCRQRLEQEDAERDAVAEQAGVIAFGFAMQDRLVALYGPAVLDPPTAKDRAAEATGRAPAPKVGRKVKAAAGGGGLWG